MEKLPSIENGEQIAPNGIERLEKRLEVIFPELSADQRLEMWIKARQDNNDFQILETEATGSKSPLIVKGTEDLIVKRFDKGAEKLGFESEKKEYEILNSFIPQKFIAQSKFVELPNNDLEDKKYFVIQEKLLGQHNKASITEALKMLDQMNEEERLEYQENPSKWIGLRRDILQKNMPPDGWGKIINNARELVSNLKRLEEGFIIDDIDFFITETGDIKLIDFQIHDKKQLKPQKNNDDFPNGSKELEMLFDF